MKRLKIQTPGKVISAIESADPKTLREINDFMEESLRSANKSKKKSV